MTPGSPEKGPGEFEARVTALLLGELSPTEAAIVRRAIDDSPNLRQLEAHLATTIELVREATITDQPGVPDLATLATPATAAGEGSSPKLSPERRSRLLEAFKTTAPPQFKPRTRSSLAWVIPMGIAAALVAMIGTVVLLPTAPTKSRLHASASGREKSEREPRRGERAGGQMEKYVKDVGRTTLLKQPANPNDPEQRKLITVNSSNPAQTVRIITHVDKLPMLGDTPLSGEFFRSEPSAGTSVSPAAAGKSTRAFLDLQPSNGAFASADERALQLATAPGAPESQFYFDSSAAGDESGRKSLVQVDATPAGESPKQQPSYRGDSLEAGDFWRFSSDGAKGLALAPHERFVKEKLTEPEVQRLLGRADRNGLEAEKPSELVARSETSDAVARGNILRKEGTALIPQPEVQTSDNPFSTFSLNVTDVSFRLAAVALERGSLPEPNTIRSEEFINAFDYRDPAPASGSPIAFTAERARYPFAHDRDLLRFSVKTAAQGRARGQALNLVLLLDKSGSMERADRVRIVQQALRVLAAQLHAEDRLSIITFARTPRLWADGMAGNAVGRIIEEIGSITPEGGTNLEEAFKLAYETARKHFLQGGGNRVVLLTDGAANLGRVDSEALKALVEQQRHAGVALDCFGVGWEGLNDDLLAVLSSAGDGRYGFLNTPEEAAYGFAGQLAGALRVAAADVKVQVEFNPKRVRSYRQIGYARHQLTTDQFRDDKVDAAEIGAAEAGNGLYVVQTDRGGSGPVAVVRVRYKDPGTREYRERGWEVPYSGSSAALEESTPAMRLAGVAAAFSEWLGSSPYAAEVTPERLLHILDRVPEEYGTDPRPKKLESMIRQAQSLRGK